MTSHLTLYLISTERADSPPWFGSVDEPGPSAGENEDEEVMMEESDSDDESEVSEEEAAEEENEEESAEEEENEEEEKSKEAHQEETNLSNLFGDDFLTETEEKQGSDNDKEENNDKADVGEKPQVEKSETSIIVVAPITAVVPVVAPVTEVAPVVVAPVTVVTPFTLIPPLPTIPTVPTEHVDEFIDEEVTDENEILDVEMTIEEDEVKFATLAVDEINRDQPFPAVIEVLEFDHIKARICSFLNTDMLLQLRSLSHAWYNFASQSSDAWASTSFEFIIQGSEAVNATNQKLLANSMRFIRTLSFISSSSVSTSSIAPHTLMCLEHLTHISLKFTHFSESLVAVFEHILCVSQLLSLELIDLADEYQTTRVMGLIGSLQINTLKVIHPTCFMMEQLSKSRLTEYLRILQLDGLKDWDAVTIGRSEVLEELDIAGTFELGSFGAFIYYIRPRILRLRCLNTDSHLTSKQVATLFSHEGFNDKLEYLTLQFASWSEDTLITVLTKCSNLLGLEMITTKTNSNLSSESSMILHDLTFAPLLESDWNQLTLPSSKECKGITQNGIYSHRIQQFEPTLIHSTMKPEEDTQQQDTYAQSITCMPEYEGSSFEEVRLNGEKASQTGAPYEATSYFDLTGRSRYADLSLLSITAQAVYEHHSFEELRLFGEGFCRQQREIEIEIDPINLFVLLSAPVELRRKLLYLKLDTPGRSHNYEETFEQLFYCFPNLLHAQLGSVQRSCPPPTLTPKFVLMNCVPPKSFRHHFLYHPKLIAPDAFIPLPNKNKDAKECYRWRIPLKQWRDADVTFPPTCYTSPIFDSLDMKWSIQIYPHSARSSDGQVFGVSAFLRSNTMMDRNPSILSAMIQFGMVIERYDGSRLTYHEGIHQFTPESTTYGFMRLATLQDWQGCLDNDEMATIKIFVYLPCTYKTLNGDLTLSFVQTLLERTSESPTRFQFLHQLKQFSSTPLSPFEAQVNQEMIVKKELESAIPVNSNLFGFLPGDLITTACSYLLLSDLLTLRRVSLYWSHYSRLPGGWIQTHFDCTYSPFQWGRGWKDYVKHMTLTIPYIRSLNLSQRDDWPAPRDFPLQAFKYLERIVFHFSFEESDLLQHLPHLKTIEFNYVTRKLVPIISSLSIPMIHFGGFSGDDDEDTCIFFELLSHTTLVQSHLRSLLVMTWNPYQLFRSDVMKRFLVLEELELVNKAWGSDYRFSDEVALGIANLPRLRILIIRGKRDPDDTATILNWFMEPLLSNPQFCANLEFLSLTPVDFNRSFFLRIMRECQKLIGLEVFLPDRPWIHDDSFEEITQDEWMYYHMNHPHTQHPGRTEDSSQIQFVVTITEPLWPIPFCKTDHVIRCSHETFNEANYCLRGILLCQNSECRWMQFFQSPADIPPSSTEHSLACPDCSQASVTREEYWISDQETEYGFTHMKSHSTKFIDHDLLFCSICHAIDFPGRGHLLNMNGTLFNSPNNQFCQVSDYYFKHRQHGCQGQVKLKPVRISQDEMEKLGSFMQMEMKVTPAATVTLSIKDQDLERFPSIQISSPVKESQPTHSLGQLQSITCMSEYENSSFEELRLYGEMKCQQIPKRRPRNIRTSEAKYIDLMTLLTAPREFRERLLHLRVDGHGLDLQWTPSNPNHYQRSCQQVSHRFPNLVFVKIGAATLLEDNMGPYADEYSWMRNAADMELPQDYERMRSQRYQHRMKLADTPLALQRPVTHWLRALKKHKNIPLNEFELSWRSQPFSTETD